jgi:hypothetical protein
MSPIASDGMPGAMKPGGMDGIIVMGSFRSGTSLTCRILSILGVDFGPPARMLKPDLFNPRGYLQRADVRMANNRLIRSTGSCLSWPDHPQHLADSGDLHFLAAPDLAWRERSPLWGMKDPRFCATLLAWFKSGAIDSRSIRIVHVSRDPEDCARSMYAMPELAKHLRPATLPSARKTIRRYVELAEWHAAHSGQQVFSLAYEDLLSIPHERIAALANFVGCKEGTQIEAAIRLMA